LLAQLAGVKDTPAGREPWSSKKCIAVPVHPTFVSTRIFFSLKFAEKKFAEKLKFRIRASL
jgi:hypothetical protein